MITFDIIIVLLVILFIIISLYFEILGPAFTFLIGVIALGFFGVLEPNEILAGFANEQIAVIILLLLLGEIIRKAEVIEIIFDRVFRKAQTYKGFLGRMMFLVSGFSAFLNNTPLVAVMMPYVHSWSKKHNLNPSKLLIPLSYAAILGGCATLIGTSTNLIVNGLLIDQKIIPGLPALNLFDFVSVGVPMIFLGFLYMFFWGHRLLPERKDVISDFDLHAREYLVETRVRSNSDLIGKTIEEAGLRNLKGLYLVEIRRKYYDITAVTPDEVIEEEDILVFAGKTDTIADLAGSTSGLQLAEEGMFIKKESSQVIEVVVSHNSTLIDKSVKEARFRGKYDAAIIAVHRNGERVSGKIGLVELKAGDVLLLLAGNDFHKRSQFTQDFYLISKVREIKKLKAYKVIALLGGTAMAILLSALGVISLFMALCILIVILILMKISSPKDLPASIDYNLAIIIALSLALGTAMIKTGFAEMIATFIISILIPLGSIGLLTGIYLITAILAAYITNKAAVALIFPIALTIAFDMNYNPMPFILIVSFAAAANFLTPIGYQTNLMVYGPGGYNFKDFFRVGMPLTVLYMIVTVVILGLQYSLF
ncbi:SLC13 family permease [Bacteroidota bacterium]